MSEIWAFVQMVTFFVKLLWRIFTNKFVMGFIVSTIFLSTPSVKTAIPLIIYVVVVRYKKKNNLHKESEHPSIQIENHNHNTAQVNTINRHDVK